VVIATVFATWFGAKSIFKMVESAYKVTLAGAFAPLVGGILWRRATTQGALCSIFGGIVSRLLVKFLVGEASLVPARLIGLVVSVGGLITGSLLPQRVGRPTPKADMHGALHHRAAAETHHAVDHPHQR
jgi:solute:Na+ symporter, SSS family